MIAEINCAGCGARLVYTRSADIKAALRGECPACNLQTQRIKGDRHGEDYAQKS